MLVDMSVDALKEYQGRNPRPADFDEYWDAAIKEMKSLDPQVELIPSDFQVPCAECFDMYYTGMGGARIHAKLLRPKNQSKPGPAVVQLHGYSGSSGDWNDKLSYVASGFTVAVIDVRGQGGRSEDVGGHKGNTLHGQIIRGLDGKPEDLLFRSIYLDCAQLTYLVMGMDNVDATKVGVFGGSQGGGLTLATIALCPEVNRAAPVYPFLTDYRRTWEMDLAVNAYSELK
ncbi:MAG: acetylxylan esterase, partial [Victivallales bacterium]|nr:acetylxylan esterase [Victivallales bacterium]